MQGTLNIHKSINVIRHINKLKNKHQMIISIDVKEVFNKIQYHLWSETLQNVGIDGTYMM